MTKLARFSVPTPPSSSDLHGILSYSILMAFDGGFRHGNAFWGFIVSNANGDILFAAGHAYTGARNAEE